MLRIQQEVTNEIEQNNENINETVSESNLSQLSLNELEAELEKAIKIEDYDRAALLRDEIKGRK